MTQSSKNTNFSNNQSNGSKAEAAKQQAGAVADTTKVEAEQVKDTAVGQAQDVKDHAVAEAQGVKDVALEAGQQVADTAKVEGAAVVGEAVDQIRSLVDATRGEVRDRTADGHRALAGTVASLSDEFSRFSRGESTSGPVAQFAGDLATRGESLSTWLQASEPEDLVVEVRRFAARRPVAFLALAAGAGVLAGRLARGTRDLADEQDKRVARPRTVVTEQQLTRPAVAEQSYLGVPQAQVPAQSLVVEETTVHAAGQTPRRADGFTGEQTGLGAPRPTGDLRDTGYQGGTTGHQGGVR